VIKKELYIIRHGQTDHNAKGIVQGKGVNLSLNEKGMKQAAMFFNAYKDYSFDKLYSSSLIRAQQTIRPFVELGIPHESMSDLDEISWGEMEGTNHILDTSDTFQNLLKEWRNGNNHARYEGGESPYDLQQRQLRFLEFLNQTSDSKILIATHGRFIRAFMCTLTGRPLSDMELFNHVNLCLYKVNLMEDGTADIEIACDTSHLEAGY
jgi:probable phosphoglycerate mutase